MTLLQGRNELYAAKQIKNSNIFLASSLIIVKVKEYTNIILYIK
jgi:hypothetical protein